MLRELREMRHWPWTERAHALYISGIFLFLLIATALIEGIGR